MLGMREYGYVGHISGRIYENHGNGWNNTVSRKGTGFHIIIIPDMLIDVELFSNFRRPCLCIFPSSAELRERRDLESQLANLSEI